MTRTRGRRTLEGIPTLEVAGNRFFNIDCVAGARALLADDSIDLIVTDPPYGIAGDTLHQHYNRNEDFVVGGYVDVEPGQYQSFTRDWVAEAHRVLRPGGSIFIVSGYTRLYEVLHALRTTPLVEVNHLIWRYSFGVYTSRKFVSSHYHILYYAKPGGRRTFNLESRFGRDEKAHHGGSANYLDREDVWSLPREYKPRREKNKNELPTELLVKILQYASDPDDLVCDFFLGGFSTARVAIGLGRRATGFEVAVPTFQRRGAALRSVTPDGLLATLHPPTIGVARNRSKRWDAAQLAALHDRYGSLREHQLTKSAAVARLGEEFGRGTFAILRALKRIDAHASARRPRTPKRR